MSVAQFLIRVITNIVSQIQCRRMLQFIEIIASRLKLNGVISDERSMDGRRILQAIFDKKFSTSDSRIFRTNRIFRYEYLFAVKGSRILIRTVQKMWERHLKSKPTRYLLALFDFFSGLIDVWLSMTFAKPSTQIRRLTVIFFREY